jgi:hypothetical protein
MFIGASPAQSGGRRALTSIYSATGWSSGLPPGSLIQGPVAVGAATDPARLVEIVGLEPTGPAPEKRPGKPAIPTFTLTNQGLIRKLVIPERPLACLGALLYHF